MNKNKKIFIIDDDSFLLNMYSMKFEKKGFETKISTSGSDALEMLRGGYKPDVLIMDLIMPIMDGFSIYESIKKEKLAPNSLSVMLTNQSTASDIDRAKELGIHGFIVKATTIPSEVVEEVEKLLVKYSK
jgi:two-component system response regulator/two-component system chemotaxis response regulator CheY